MGNDRPAPTVTPVPAPSDPTMTADEIGTLARDLAGAYRRMAAFYHDQLELSGPEADVRARGLDYTDQEGAEDLDRIRSRPPDQVSWFDLNRLAERDPDALGEIWAHIKREARRELASGHRTAQALDWNGRPWQRARFLAIRDSFRVSTAPQNGIEAALLDVAAESFGDYLEWTEHLHMQAGSEVETEQRRLERDGAWQPARLSMADAIEHSAKMAERAHTRFLRTIKMVYELQRSSRAVYVGHARQINVGRQQVNVADVAHTASAGQDED